MGRVPGAVGRRIIASWLRLVITVSALLLCLPALAAARPRTTFITYSGTYEDTVPIAFSTQDPTGIPGDVSTAEIHWVARAAITSRDLNTGVQKHWRYSTLFGSFEANVNPTPGNSGYHCNEPLREKQGYESTVEDAVNIFWDQGRKTYMLTVGVPFNSQALTTGLPQLSTCAAFAARSLPTPADKTGAKLVFALQPTITVPAGGPYIFYPAAIWNDPLLPAFDRVDSELVISAGIRGVPPPPEAPLPPPDEKPRLKAAARADLPGALENAKAYCLPYATGLGTFGAGVLVLGAGGFTGGVLTTAGSLMAAISEPFCVATLQRLKNDILTIYDPPDQHIFATATPAKPAAATLPSCPQFTGQNASFCQTLRPQLATLLADAQKVAGISAAIATTTNRLSAALRAHNPRASHLQSRDGQRLENQETGALAAQETAGHTVATTLESAGLAMPLTAGQASTSDAYVTHYLATHGVSASSFRRLAGAVLNPTPLNVLAVLG
jgi:hypothetical protein